MSVLNIIMVVYTAVVVRNFTHKMYEFSCNTFIPLNVICAMTMSLFSQNFVCVHQVHGSHFNIILEEHQTHG